MSSGQFPRWLVLDGTFAKLYLIIAAAHGAGIFRDPDDLAIEPEDARFEIGCHAFLVEQANELGVALRIHIESWRPISRRINKVTERVLTRQPEHSIEGHGAIIRNDSFTQ